MIDIIIENVKDFTGLKKKLFQIFRAITSQLTTNETSISSLQSNINALESNIADMQENFVDVRNVFPFGAVEVICRYAVGNTVTQTIADNDRLVISFEDELQLSPYVATSATNSIFTVQVPGIYLINASILLNAISDDLQQVETDIRVNGLALKRSRFFTNDVDATQEGTVIPVLLNTYLNAGDEVDIRVLQNNSNNVNRTVNNANINSNVSITFLGNFS